MRQQRRLAGAVRADQADDVARRRPRGRARGTAIRSPWPAARSLRDERRGHAGRVPDPPRRAVQAIMSGDERRRRWLLRRPRRRLPPDLRRLGRTIAYQAGVLVPLLRRLGVPDGGRVLDASCGIGTQALGLAAAGYAVTGTDLSPGAVERARAEAAARGLDATFARGRPAAARRRRRRRFDCVLSCDNSFAHMLEDAELAAAARRAGGLHRAGRRRLRQHPAVRRARRGAPGDDAAARPAGTDERWTASFQIWDWDADGGARTGWSSSCCASGRAAGGRRAPTRRGCGPCAGPSCSRRSPAAGLEDVQLAAAEDSGYYQPIVGRPPARSRV